jgi:DNA-binding transcriptional regulator YiaG
MTKKKIFVAVIIGIVLLFGGSLAVFEGALAKKEIAIASEDNNSLEVQEMTKERMITAMVNDLRKNCQMIDEEIAKEGLNKQEIKKVREFCSLSKKEMGKVLKERIERVKNWRNNESVKDQNQMGRLIGMDSFMASGQKKYLIGITSVRDGEGVSQFWATPSFGVDLLRYK